MKSTILKGVVISALVSSASLAVAANTQQSTSPVQNFYVGANVGYLHTPWKDTVGTGHADPAIPDFDNWKNGNGGLGFGADLGYMFQPWIGVEAGWMHTPTVKVTVTPPGVPVALPETVINNNAFYAAVKLAHGLNVTNLSLFTKAGIGYQNTDVKNGGDKINNADTIGFFGSIGLDYAATQNIHVDGSVTLLTGYAKHDSHKFTTDLSYFNVGLSYHF
jgi:opacity protein-like surface antigen